MKCSSCVQRLHPTGWSLCVFEPMPSFIYLELNVMASVLGCVIILQLGAFSVILEVVASDVTELLFVSFVGIVQPSICPSIRRRS